eukprot:scpid63937/ scgid32955/ 
MRNGGDGHMGQAEERATKLRNSLQNKCRMCPSFIQRKETWTSLTCKVSDVARLAVPSAVDLSFQCTGCCQCRLYNTVTGAYPLGLHTGKLKAETRRMVVETRRRLRPSEWQERN